MSSYLVLARKYRPHTFDEVIGQEVVTRVLAGALQEGRVGHAYLFSGPRGTGKTTTARVFAKCLNCEQGPTATPCGTCERCIAADTGSEVDILEIDAASHTGVDNVRELRDEAAYAPMRARYKVYIVDEVHMLSKAAFNALLKILEEPPAHVVFLFATTEPHKVLDTILSRCQVLRLSPLTEEQISSRLEAVFALEDVQPGAGVVRELARSARGGMRDALSMADKLLALAGSQPTLEDFTRLLGEGGAREIAELLGFLEAGDKAALLSALGRFNGDEGELLVGLLEALRECVLLAHCGADTPIVLASDEERTRAVERAGRLGVERIELWMQELLHARERMRIIPGQERLILEITLLDLCRPEISLPLAELVARLERLESRTAAGSTPVPAPAPVPTKGAATQPVAAQRKPEPAKSAPVRSEPVRNVPAPAKPPPAAGGDPLAGLWNPFLAELGRTHRALATLFEQRGSPRSLAAAGTGKVALSLTTLGQDETRLVDDRRNRVAVSRALSTIAGRTLEVQIAGSAGSGETEKAAAPKGERVEQVKDEFTHEVADLFGGVIEDLK